MNKNMENMYPFHCLFLLFVWFLFFSRILCYREGGGKALGTRLRCLRILSVSKITCLPAKHEPHWHCFHCPLLLVTVLLYHSLTWWSFLKDSSIFFMCHTVGKLSFKKQEENKAKIKFYFRIWRWRQFMKWYRAVFNWSSSNQNHSFQSSQSQRTQTVQRTNQISKESHVTDAKPRSAGKGMRASHDCFCFYFWLDERVAQVSF